MSNNIVLTANDARQISNSNPGEWADKKVQRLLKRIFKAANKGYTHIWYGFIFSELEPQVIGKLNDLGFVVKYNGCKYKISW